MNRADIYNSGADFRAAFGDMVTVTAGGAGDNTEANGDWVSRKDADGSIAMSAKCILVIEGTLAATQSLSLLANFQDAADGAGAGAADYGTPFPVTTVLSSTPGGTLGTVVELDVNFSSAREFVRIQFTPNLSAGATDTARIAVVWCFGGQQRGPASNTVV